MKYNVYMTIYNCYEIEAESEKEAEEIVRDLGVYATLKGANYEIEDVEEVA